MPRVFVPPALRSLTDGATELDVEGGTVGAVIDALDARFPGVRDRLCDGDAMKPGLAVVVDGDTTSLGRLRKVTPDAEVHFLPAIGGG